MRTPSPLFYCIVSLIFLVGPASAESQERVTLARAGKSSCVIVQADNATEPEKFAAKELATFLKRVTGGEFPIVKERSLTGNRASRIYVGWTEYAGRQGIDTSKLGEEEWVIRTIDDDLVLTGGRPRGTMYAVYEFLEDHVGCHWLDRETEVIPSKPTLEVGSLDIRAKPHFWQRQLHSPTGSPDNHWLFLIRNKNFRYHMKGRTEGMFFPKGAFSRTASPRTSIHSFSTFVSGKEWFDDASGIFFAGEWQTHSSPHRQRAGAALFDASGCAALDDHEAARVHRSRPCRLGRCRRRAAEIVLDHAERCLSRALRMRRLSGHRQTRRWRERAARCLSERRR